MIKCMMKLFTKKKSPMKEIELKQFTRKKSPIKESDLKSIRKSILDEISIKNDKKITAIRKPLKKNKKDKTRSQLYKASQRKSPCKGLSANRCVTQKKRFCKYVSGKKFNYCRKKLNFKYKD